jgi:manganese-dependent inorganic pyrophosphatase
MQHKTFVFGHQNPDTDSLCSAIAYADLKNKLGYSNVFPARLGPVNKESAFVFKTFNITPPELIKDVKPQISDLILTDHSRAFETDSILKTMEKIINHPGRSLPVVDENDKLIGIVSLSDIIPAYTDSFSKSILKDNATPIDNIIELLSAQVYGSIKNDRVTGNVYTITEISDNQTLDSQDILITVYQPFYLERAFKTNAGIIIISNASPDHLFQIPNNFNGVVLIVHSSPFEVIRLLCQGIPITHYFQRQNIEYFISSETIDDVKKNILSSEHDRFPVVNSEGCVISSISRSNLVDYNRKKVILVDHNERSQSINGVNEAEIIEVIDHHRIADIQTSNPLYLRIEPVGCTATIIAKMYHEHTIAIPKPIAGLLLSAIISDTLLFKSPTATSEDKEIADELCRLLKIDLNTYGQKMLIAGSNLKEMTPNEIISTDIKFFTMGQYKIAVSQINTGDFRGIYEKLEDVRSEMSQLCTTQNLNLSILMVTDIIIGGTELIISGNLPKITDLAFGIPYGEFSKFLPGVFSRKKQIIPPLMNASTY